MITLRNHFINIFYISLAASFTLLCIERSLGINWDFHVDSVTYATTAKDVANELTQDGFLRLINGTYYVIVSFLDQNIAYVTIYNALLFASTNFIISTVIYKYSKNKNIEMNWIYYAYLFNPYRLHLSTTLLKDTTVIFLLSTLFLGLTIALPFLISLIFVRVASVFYFLSFLDKKILIYMAIVLAILLLNVPFVHDILINRLDESNTVNIRARDYDLVPNWQSLGYFGSFLRALIWPFLAFTGLFVLFAPVPELIIVSLGSIVNIFLIRMISSKHLPFTSSLYLACSIIAIIAPGFNAFIRYIYPLIALSPLFILRYSRNIKI
tara:strand:- start:80 stop:1051 length:972 start_codon:yes stop_codon:yes gene_type:complete